MKVPDGRTGAEHELQIAFDLWKEHLKPDIKLYFLKKKYHAESEEELIQQRSLLRFKKRLAKHALWCECKGKAQFEELVEKHIRDFLSKQAEKLFGVRDSYGWPGAPSVPRRAKTEEITFSPVSAPNDQILLRSAGLLDRPEFSEIRITFGPVLGTALLGHLLKNDVGRAEALIAGCGFTENRRYHFLKVAGEAIRYLSSS